MIAGVHTVRKARKANEMPIWYVYAFRGGPLIHRHVGWAPPTLSHASLSKLIEASDARIERIESKQQTLGSLIREWRPDSPEWKGMSDSTKRTWGSSLNKIDERWGGAPLSVWNDPRMAGKVVLWRDERSKTPRSADFGITVLRALLKFGRLRGKVSINVAEGIPQLYRNGNRAEIIWTDDDILAFGAACKELDMMHVYDGLRLAALTGLRKADLVSLTWDEVTPHAIIKRAAKESRGKRRTATMPRILELDMLLEELRQRKRADGVATVLVNSFGQAWSGDGFGGSFGRVRDHAGIVHIDPDTGARRLKHLHDVRGTFCTKLFIAELTDQEVAAVMAWSPSQVAGIRRSYVDQSHINVAMGRWGSL